MSRGNPEAKRRLFVVKRAPRRRPKTPSKAGDVQAHQGVDKWARLTHGECEEDARNHGRDMEELRPLKVQLRVSDPALVDDLVRFFRKRESSAERLDEDTVEVSILHVLNERQARLELDLYLRVWQSLHGWSRVEYLEMR